MKTNKLLIFAIAIVFLASVNFAFAVDENVTQTVSEADDTVLEIEETPQEISADDSDDVVAANDYSNVGDDVKTIVMGKVTKRYNGAIEYSASFYDKNGSPLRNTQVMFELDDYNDYRVNTDSNGVALLRILINNGNHKIAAYNIPTGGIDFANIKVFDVLTGAKNINMYYDNGNVYKVRVFDDNGNPVKAGQKVTFTFNGKKYTRTTDKNGYASFKITAKPGRYTIYAQYKDFKVGNYITVKDVIKAKTGKVKPGSKIKFQVKFLGKKKKNKLIKVKFNKKTYKAKTNRKGIAIFKLKNPNKAGKFKIVVSYKKSKGYYTYTQH